MVSTYRYSPWYNTRLERQPALDLMHGFGLDNFCCSEMEYAARFFLNGILFFLQMFASRILQGKRTSLRPRARPRKYDKKKQLSELFRNCSRTWRRHLHRAQLKRIPSPRIRWTNGSLPPSPLPPKVDGVRQSLIMNEEKKGENERNIPITHSFPPDVSPIARGKGKHDFSKEKKGEEMWSGESNPSF